MAKLIDINCDMGEISETWLSGRDKSLLRYITSVNISCGVHAGDVFLIRDTIHEALALGLKVGAHPSYPDKENFGRLKISLTIKELKTVLHEQILFVKEIVDASGGILHHIKPHGALYNEAASETAICEAICDVMKGIDPNLVLYSLAGSKGSEKAIASGLKVWQEAFVDRTYENDGSLRKRSLAFAMTETPELALKQFRELKKGKVTSYENGVIHVRADTICIHGDGKNALAIAKLIHKERAL